MVYRGYLDSRGGKDMVAIKICKGKDLHVATSINVNGDLVILAILLASEKEKLLKEVTTMLSFDHPNVMSLIGVCFDGEIPMIIMPYMSNGSVLEYVKQNKTELFYDSEVKKVYMTLYS